MVIKDNVGVAVLVGGKSSRMGYNKAFLKFEKLTVLENAVSMLSSVFSEVFLVGCDSRLYLSTGLQVFVDIYKNCGPLGGIHCALYFSQKPYVFICACDMPFIEPKLVAHMARYILDYDIVVPYSRGGAEPSRKIMDIISSNLMSGQGK